MTTWTNDDGSQWTIDGELEDLLVSLTQESERRGTNFVGDNDPMYALGEAAGFDGSALLRLLKVCLYQQRRIEELERWVEQQGA
jgi:hypothetical protein